MVRLFPGATRRRVLVVSTAILAIGGLTVPLADAKGDSHKHKLEQRHHFVQQREKRVGQDLDDSSAALRHATASLAAARDKLTSARSRLRQLDRSLAAARAADARLQRELAVQRQRLAQAQAQVRQGRSDVTAQRDALRDTVLAEFTQGDPALHQLSALVGGGSLDDVTRQEAYSDAVTSSQDSVLQHLQAAQTLLTVHEQNVADAAAAVADEEQQAAAKVAEVKELQARAISARNDVLGLVVTRRNARAEAVRVKAHDQQVLATLRKREARIREQILRAASTEANRQVASTGGMFVPPVSDSYITSPYGWRIHPIYHYWGLHDGDDLHAPCGTPERAVDTGKVISEYYSSVWGHRLYLSLGRVNGHSYTAIYNHISSYRAHVGQVVGRGETVAYAGTTGWSTACHLHFTILKDGTAVDPAPLIGF
jgi:murein DD-endopeptidase MepM/ murein hydrolase activator NlpD